MAKKPQKSSKLTEKEVKRFALSQGADVVGIASVESLLEASLPEGRRPWDILPGAKSVVSFYMMGIDTPRLLRDDWFLGTPEHSINFVLLGSGWPGATQVDLLGYKIARFLIHRGFKAIPIPSGHPYDKINLRGIISQKHAAVAAGLGEIGFNQLLLVPKFGCNVYPGSVLTTAVLKANPKYEKRLCEETRKDCNFLCVSSCHSKAIKKDGSFDKKECHVFLYEGVGKRFGYPPHQHMLRCGVCMNVCPAGKPTKKIIA